MGFGLAETAKLAVDLSLKGNFASSLSASEKALGRFDKAITSSQGRAYKAGQQIGTGIKTGAVIAAAGVGILITQVVAGLASLARLDDVVTQTNAALKSTKGVAGETAASLRDLANKYEDLNATIDDTVIQSGENLLLTFTNIRKQAFEPTLQAALDMNQALGGGEAGLSNTIRILGKALNDPLKGLTALQRVGVRFTDTQKAEIAAALKAGDTFKAQGVILAELNKRFGGSFLAGGSTTTGKIAKFKDAIDDLQRVLATALLPVIGKVADKLSVMLSDPHVIKTVNDLGQSIADLFSDKNLAEGGKILGTLFDTAKAAAPVLKDAAVATLGVVKAAVGLFTSLPKEVQQLAIGAFAINKITGGLVTNVAGGLISSVLKQLVSGVVNVNGAVVNVVGAGVPGVPGVVPTGGGGTSLLGKVLKSLPWIAVGAVIAEGFIQGNKDHPETYGTQGALGPRGLQAPGRAPIGPATTIGGAMDRALIKLGLGPAITKGQQLAELNARRIEAAENRQIVAVTRGLSAVDRTFRNQLEGLKKATKANDVAKFAKQLAKEIAGGKGSFGSTKDTLATLKGKLAETHDPKLQAVLRHAIAQVQAKLPNREWVQGQLDAAKKIVAGTESEKRKLDQLNAIQRTLRSHGDTHAAKTVAAMAAVGKKVDAAKAKIAGDTRAEGIGIRNTIKAQDLSVKVNVYNNLSITNRSMGKAQTTHKLISGFVES